MIIIKIKFMIISFVSMTLIFVLIFIFVNRGSDSYTAKANDENTYLAKVVYNNIIKEEEKLVPVDIPKIDSSTDQILRYSKLRVIESCYFKTTFDFQLEPYFLRDHLNKEVELIVAIIEVFSAEYERWYQEDMLIIKNDEEIVGFLSPSSGGLYRDKHELLKGEFLFGSYIFLTDEAVTKYYDRDDMIYHFTVDLIDKENIEIEIEYGIAFSENKNMTQSISQKDTFKYLDSDVVVDLINLVKIEKIFLDAVITEIDLNEEIIYISSLEKQSLISVELLGTGKVVDEEGNIVELTNLKIGDKIVVYCYDKYKSYEPVNILVDEIVVKND